MEAPSLFPHTLSYESPPAGCSSLTFIVGKCVSLSSMSYSSELLNPAWGAWGPQFIASWSEATWV